MKVMLKKDVHGAGREGDIVTVADGYANNYLIPRGLAVAADAGVINAAKIRKQAQKHRLEIQRQNAAELAKSMSRLSVKVYAKAGENGRLFGSVTGKEVSDALKEQFDISVDKKKIRFDEPIKAIGLYTVTAHMFEQTDAKFKVEVLPSAE